VIGVFDVNFAGNNDREAIESIYVPFTTFQQAFNFGDIVGWFSFTPKPGIEAEVLEEKILKVLKERHSIAPDDERAFGYWNESREFKKMSTLFLGIEMLIWIVGTGTLLAGIIGVSNIMLIVVKERTKEIGIRKSLGATPWNIISQILTEAVVLTSIAGYLGLVAAVGIIELVNKAISENPEPGMFRNPEVNFNVAITAIIVLIVAGLFAGFIPARKAASVSPVEALRYE
jgi:putative ABC transport system permease protein